MYGLFEDHSVALWMLRHFVCAAAGLGGYEGMLFMVDPRGTNGGYYASLEYAKHFMGTGASKSNINNPNIAALVGRRVVAVNETPSEGHGGSSGTFNTTLAKSLASGDEPLSAMAKYKDPMSYKPQCLLVFCTNCNPEVPGNDGGFKSRVSYVTMPFEWVAQPTEPGQRRIDVSIKERVVKTLQPEFFFWARLLAPGLLNPKGRLITPQPIKVLEDKEVQFTAGITGATSSVNVPPLKRLDTCSCMSVYTHGARASAVGARAATRLTRPSLSGAMRRSTAHVHTRPSVVCSKATPRRLDWPSTGKRATSIGRPFLMTRV